MTEVACPLCGGKLWLNAATQPLWTTPLPGGISPPSAAPVPQQVVVQPTLFVCPSCRQTKAWLMEKPPWPQAVCMDCFRARRVAGAQRGA